MPFITVGIPTYNRSKMLLEAVKSVQKQSFEDIEILIIDDGSLDETPQVCRAIGQSDPRIRYIRNEKNLGQAGNWRRIAEAATAPYLKYLMDDDLLLPDCLSSFTEATRQWPECSLIACLSVSFDLGLPATISTQPIYVPPLPIDGTKMLKFLALWSNQIGCPTNVMFRLDALRQVYDLWKDTQGVVWKYDILAFANVLRYGQFVCLPEPLVAIREHSGSGTAALRAREMQQQEEELLYELARLAGGGRIESRYAEMHSARRAFVRAVQAIPAMDIQDARFFFLRWFRSREALWAFQKALYFNYSEILPPSVVRIARLVRRSLKGSGVLKSQGSSAAKEFRFPEMAQFWHKEMDL